MFSVIHSQQENDKLKELLAFRNFILSFGKCFRKDIRPTQIQNAILEQFFILSEVKNFDETAEMIESGTESKIHLRTTEIKRISEFLYQLERDFDTLWEIYENMKKS